MARIRFSDKRLALCAVLLVLAGCQEQEQIRSYTVKKESFEAAAGGEKLRLLAVMAPRDKEVWFFKLMGPEKNVGEQVETFDRFVASVHFIGEGSARYATPEGWQKLPGKLLPGGGQMLATLRREGEGPRLEITLTTLPAAARDPRSNLNRWRGQLGLGPIGEGELTKLVGNVKVDGVEGTRVDFVGPGAGKKRPKAGAALGVRPFQFTKPDDWDERSSDSPKGIYRAAVFRVRDGEHLAEVSVVPLTGNGGGALANVNRWRMQVGLDAIGDAQLTKDLRKLEAADGPAPYVDLLGRGPTGPQRILGAWIAHGGRTWFITMKGFPALVGKQQSAFEAFVKSIRFADGGGVEHE